MPKWAVRGLAILSAIALLMLIMVLFLITKAHFEHQFNVTLFGGY
jgi:hypothetical protein